MSRLMRRRFGLRARMTASYVLVTAAAVIAVEAVAIGFLIPSYLAGQDLANRVAYTASSIADELVVQSVSPDTLQLPSGFAVGTQAALGPGKVADDGSGLVVPETAVAYPSADAPLTMALVLSPDGTVMATSYPARYPVGAAAATLVPAGAMKFELGSHGATSSVGGHDIAWDVEPVYVQLTRAGGIPGTKDKQPDAYVYVQAPVQGFTVAGSLEQLSPLLQAGVAVLLFALPVGAVFGLLTTRGTVRRLGRLAGTATLVADGDFTHRVPQGGADELGRLERSFNEMAERLTEAMGRERALADRGARQAERNRISRELHDSISQDLFSIALLGAGLEKALPERSPLRKQARTLVETVEATNREMRALLMELRPAALDDRGLVPALEDLAAAYRARFGVDVETDLEAVSLTPAVELAALRIAQEGFANAVRHAQPKTIRLALRGADGRAELVIADDGQGFVPGTNGSVERLGLRLMRERVEELDGTLVVASRPGEGTVLSASLPRRPA